MRVGNASELRCAHLAAIALGRVRCHGRRAGPAIAAGCAFEPQGEGRVAAVIDARSFRLEDGREVRLAGIEPVAAEKSQDHIRRWPRSLAGREVSLRGRRRYARPLWPPARLRLSRCRPKPWCRLSFWRRARRWSSATVTDKECAAAADGRRGRRRARPKEASGPIPRP